MRHGEMQDQLFAVEHQLCLIDHTGHADRYHMGGTDRGCNNPGAREQARAALGEPVATAEDGAPLFAPCAVKVETA